MVASLPSPLSHVVLPAKAMALEDAVLLPQDALNWLPSVFWKNERPSTAFKPLPGWRRPQDGLILWRLVAEEIVQPLAQEEREETL
jgi:hypothetical protein